MVTKQELRAEIRLKRQGLKPEERAQWSQALCEQLRDFMVQHQVQRLFGFMPTKGEPDITLCWQSSAAFPLALPRVGEPGFMDFYLHNPEDHLSPNQFGIPEPPGHPQTLVEPTSSKDLILVPALAIDHHGKRLGHGAGYYDRYLARYHQANTMGVTFETFYLPDVPTEEHDISLKHVLTEKGLK